MELVGCSWGHPHLVCLQERKMRTTILLSHSFIAFCMCRHMAVQEISLFCIDSVQKLPFTLVLDWLQTRKLDWLQAHVQLKEIFKVIVRKELTEWAYWCWIAKWESLQNQSYCKWGTSIKWKCCLPFVYYFLDSLVERIDPWLTIVIDQF